VESPNRWYHKRFGVVERLIPQFPPFGHYILGLFHSFTLSLANLVPSVRYCETTEEIAAPPRTLEEFMQSSEYLATPAAAAFTGLAVSTLNKLRLTGAGPEYIKLGRRVIYARDSVEDWMRSKRRTSTSDPGAIAA
jgi:predicted DNA-binding transcriptional regulator AlpA